MQKFVLSKCRHRAITAPIVGNGARTQFPLRRGGLAINNAQNNSMRWYSVGGIRYSSGNGRSVGRLAGPVLDGRLGAGVRTIQERGYASSSSSSGKSEADEMVEELQDLYEIAKDEFEIATESTDSSTIYASSDRSTAREALSDFESLYTHYTSPPTTTASPTTFPNPADTSPTPYPDEGERETEAEDETRTPTELNEPGVDGEMTGSGGKGQEGGGGLRPNFNVEAIAPEVREEVRRRVGQRVRELKRAVEALEERALE